ncbi:Obg family GTPase CgtA [Lentibacillus sp. CBA3610]|uniref:Obg family GTPase CgtA n=1 Tax=Lentibacillus sp. CBA3610 TaxID=2518176 RepID=UPI0020D22361|nr:Obg family GTPase CgtA [Lentibacillus sp. CBA3610]
MERPQIVAANKMDMPGAEENLQEFKSKLNDEYPVYTVSALTKEGLREIVFALADTLDQIPKYTQEIEESDEQVVYRYQKEETPFTITRDSDGSFVLSGDKLEKLFKMTDFTKDEAVQRFARQLRGMGVDDALRKRGAKDGDTIRLKDFEFEFIE